LKSLKLTLNYYENGSSLEAESYSSDTANLKIIDARYHDFNGFPVVDWHQKPLKADNGRQLF
jgi:hypothetical protein